MATRQAERRCPCRGAARRSSDGHMIASRLKTVLWLRTTPLVLCAGVLSMATHNALAKTCLAQLACQHGSSETSDPFPARYPEAWLGTVPIYINYCEKVSEKNIAHPIRDSKVVGFDEACRRVLSGQYDSAGQVGVWKLYRRDGSVMKRVDFSRREGPITTYISKSGKTINFDVDLDELTGRPIDTNSTLSRTTS